MVKVNAFKISGLFLLTAQSLAFTYVMMQYWLYNPPTPSNTPNRTHILILSTWRSGSSFTGQIFSQHPDVFYLMEPGWHVWNTMTQDTVKVLHMAVQNLVRSIFLCDMSVFDAYLPEERRKSDLFQWESSRALCSPPACDFFKRGDIIPQLSCKVLCVNDSFNTIEQTCKTYSHIVQKVVRFFSLKVLYPLLQDPTLNLKILHLVRDPRAVFQSRMKTASSLLQDSAILIGRKNSQNKEGPYELIEKICRSQAEIYQFATNGSLRQLHERYMMVRYEDIINDPVKKAKQMYQFGNLDFKPKLENWIFNLTHGKGYGDDFVITSRNALDLARVWRNALPFDAVQRIQNICREAMDMFGYRFINSEVDQIDSKLGLLLPFPERAKTILNL